MKWLAGSAVAAGSLFALVLFFSPPADGIVLSGYFDDDNGTTFEGDIDAIAAAGITRGCNPPTNTAYCPEDDVNRGAMAAFLRRALDLPYVTTDYFDDDNDSIFERDINAIAAAGITRGCNPPTNTAYCVGDDVRRGPMAAFLRRALRLPFITVRIPVGNHEELTCSKDGLTCRMTVDLSANRIYRIEEGLFQVTPASSGEQAAFDSTDTSFRLDVDGVDVSVTELAQRSSGNTTSRVWRRDQVFSVGGHTMRARWFWDGELIQTNILTIRAAG